MLRRVADALNAKVRVVFEPKLERASLHVAEPADSYRVKQRAKKQRRNRVASLEKATDERYGG